MIIAWFILIGGIICLIIGDKYSMSLVIVGIVLLAIYHKIMWDRGGR